MTAPASLSNQTAAPSGAEAGRLTPTDLLLLIIVQLLILWAEGLATSPRERTETTDLTAITRRFGTTDIALILERITYGLQRLEALERAILANASGLATDPQPNPITGSTRHSPSASQPPGRKPARVPHLSLPALAHIAAAPVRATGPPEPLRSVRTAPTGPVHPLTRGAWQAPPCRFPLPVPASAT